MSFASTETKVLTDLELAPQIAAWRNAGERIVFTNGVFDLLHVGHITYLEAARALGDRLILGLNADASVRRLKGPTRPVNHEQARARVLAALACIDAIVLFGEDTPLDLITHVQPDVLVKGGDYQLKDIVGHELVQARGGLVTTITFVDGYSTTATIKKMQG